MPTIPALRRWKPEDHEFKASLDSARPSSRRNKKRRRRRKRRGEEDKRGKGEEERRRRRVSPLCHFYLLGTLCFRGIGLT